MKNCGGGLRYLSNGFSRQLLTDFPLSTAGSRCCRCTLVVRIVASLKASTPLSERTAAHETVLAWQASADRNPAGGLASRSWSKYA